MPLNYHPSFAGNSEHLRIAATNSISIVKKYGPYQSFQTDHRLSVDQFIGKIHSGVGIQLAYENYKEKFNSSSPSEISNAFKGKFILAPKFSFSGKYTLSPSVELNKSYSNQIAYHSNYSIDSGNSTNQKKYKWSSTLIVGGLMFNSSKFFVGVSYSLYDKTKFFDTIRPKIYHYNFKTVTFITGYTYKRSESAKFSITPIILIQHDFFISHNNYLNWSNISNDFTLNLTFKYKKVVAGIDTKGDLMLGYEGEKLRIMLIQRYEAFYNKYTAQVSLRYLFGPTKSTAGYK